MTTAGPDPVPLWCWWSNDAGDDSCGEMGRYALLQQVVVDEDDEEAADGDGEGKKKAAITFVTPNLWVHSSKLKQQQQEQRRDQSHEKEGGDAPSQQRKRESLPSSSLTRAFWEGYYAGFGNSGSRRKS